MSDFADFSFEEPPQRVSESIVFPDVDDLVSSGSAEFINTIRKALVIARSNPGTYALRFQNFLLGPATEAILQIGENGGEGEIGEEALMHLLPVLLTCPKARDLSTTIGGGEVRVPWQPFYTRMGGSYHRNDRGYTNTNGYSAAPDIPQRARDVAAELGGAWIALAHDVDVYAIAIMDPHRVIEALHHIPAIARRVGFSSAKASSATRQVASAFIDI